MANDDVLSWLDGTPYRAEKVIGRGGMGVVVAATHEALGRSLCVKVLRPEASQHPGVIDRFRQEAQTLAKLGGGKHPNLVHVSDFGETTGGMWFLAMERLVGRTLDEERRQRGALPWGEACALVLQALAGLAVAHEAGLVHRDIKPANLFVCDPDVPGGPRVVKVLDFGIAKILELASIADEVQRPHLPTAPGTAIGTPRYMAPEQLAGRPPDVRWDVYAMALVLHSLLSGRPPHEGLDGEALFAAQLRQPLAALPASVPQAITAVVARASSKSPSDRPADAAELARAIERAVKSPASPPTRDAATPAHPSAGSRAAGAPARSTGPRGTERVLESPAPLPVLEAPPPPAPPGRNAAQTPAPREGRREGRRHLPRDEGTTSRMPATGSAHGGDAAEDAEPTALHQPPSRVAFALAVVGATVVLTAVFGLLFTYLRGGP